MTIIGGAGEWLAQRVLAGLNAKSILSLAGVFGPAISGCVAAYAVAILAAEKRV